MGECGSSCFCELATRPRSSQLGQVPNVALATRLVAQTVLSRQQGCTRLDSSGRSASSELAKNQYHEN